MDTGAGSTEASGEGRLVSIHRAASQGEHGPGALVAEIADALMQRRRPDGAFVVRPGGRAASVESTAWAALALSASGRHEGAIAAARDFLRSVQGSDGRVLVSPDAQECVWPTPLAVMAWHGETPRREAADRAVHFLLATTGAHAPSPKDSVYGHDTSIRGWPWVSETHSWVEPTSQVLMALQVSGRAEHPRVSEATRMILDRQLSSGGWNFGNTRVFGAEPKPMTLSTGMALAAVHGLVDQEAVARSIDWLAGLEEELRTPLSLAWALLGLAAWGRRPSQGPALLATALESQARMGAFDTPELALLALASAAPTGLVRALSQGWKVRPDSTR